MEFNTIIYHRRRMIEYYNYEIKKIEIDIILHDI